MDSTAAIRACLRDWLAARIPAESLAWLDERRPFFLAFSAVARRFGRDALDLTDAERDEAESVRPGWRPGGWTRDQAARAFLVLGLSPDDLADTLDKAFASADEGELVALYRTLPLLPHPEAHVTRCAEGIRTNMTSVFTAVAHDNPYPSERLDEAAWNQMVLKALFVGVALDPIAGLDARANPALMRMLCDYAHERWAAGRAVSPELWRCVGPHADAAALADLKRVLENGDANERQAAALALRSCPAPEAAALVAEHGVTAEMAWSDLA